MIQREEAAAPRGSLTMALTESGIGQGCSSHSPEKISEDIKDF